MLLPNFPIATLARVSYLKASLVIATGLFFVFVLLSLYFLMPIGLSLLAIPFPVRSGHLLSELLLFRDLIPSCPLPSLLHGRLVSMRRMLVHGVAVFVTAMSALRPRW